MDETMKLINMAHEGDKAARDQLVMDNVGLIWSIVRRFSGRGYEMEDLFQIGSIGLIKAIDKFDTGFEVKFSTYAVPMITGEIKRFLRDDGMIKVSRSIKELGFKVRAAREEMTYSLGREPTIEEIAARLETSREEVAASMEAGAEVESLYRPTGNGDDNTMFLMDRLEEENNDHEELLNRMVLKELMEDLSDEQREIIVRRYFYNQTQTQIAGELGISQVQVSRLEKRILKEISIKLFFPSILSTRTNQISLRKGCDYMGFGKRVCEILAVIGAIVLIGILVWYLSSGMRDKGYEKEGTLVWEEQNPLSGEGLGLEEPWNDGEAAYPAFVTDPVSMIYGEQEIQRSGKGL